jgi:hypothetical protein
MLGSAPTFCPGPHAIASVKPGPLLFAHRFWNIPQHAQPPVFGCTPCRINLLVSLLSSLPCTGRVVPCCVAWMSLPHCSHPSCTRHLPTANMD